MNKIYSSLTTAILITLTFFMFNQDRPIISFIIVFFGSFMLALLSTTIQEYIKNKSKKNKGF